MSLSNKILVEYKNTHKEECILIGDIKESVRELKEAHQKLSDVECSWDDYDKRFKKKIDNIFGKKLI